MKKNLGKLLIILLTLFRLPIYAHELANYKIEISKDNPYQREALTITFTAQQLDHTTNIFFFLKPKKSNDYKIYLLKKRTKELAYHNAITTFEYILFPLHAKTISIDFNFIVKTASDQAVKQAYIADHDDSIAIRMNAHTIEVEPLILHVQKLEHTVDLVGDFKLKTKIDKKTMNQYESLNLLYTLQGVGYINKDLTLLPKLANVTQFFETDSPLSKLTQNGFAIKKNFIYSLSAKDNFTVPSLSIHAFSPKKKQYYTLKTPPYDIKVKKIAASTLLDKEEFPKQTASLNTESIKEFFIYLFLFGIGYISAKLEIPLRLKKRTKYKDIKESSNPKALLYTLMHSYADKGLEHYYAPLEDMAYGKKGKKSFAKIKREILKSLQ